jgi:hypothetical protein
MAKASLNPTRVPEADAEFTAARNTRPQAVALKDRDFDGRKKENAFILTRNGEMNDDIGIARGISRENIETTLMRLDDAAGNGQAKTHAGVSCGKKRLGRATGGLGSETAAGIAHLND